jgi:hypothetical protein
MLTTLSMTRKAVERSSRLGIIPISYELLATLLRLPAKMTIVDVERDFKRNGIMIKVTSPDIKENNEGTEISDVLQGQGDWIEKL